MEEKEIKLNKAKTKQPLSLEKQLFISFSLSFLFFPGFISQLPKIQGLIVNVFNPLKLSLPYIIIESPSPLPTKYPTNLTKPNQTNLQILFYSISCLLLGKLKTSRKIKDADEL